MAEGMTPTEPTPQEHMKSLLYMNSLSWIAGFVQMVADNSDFTVEQVEAQVQKDLKYLLDQRYLPH